MSKASGMLPRLWNFFWLLYVTFTQRWTIQCIEMKHTLLQNQAILFLYIGAKLKETNFLNNIVAQVKMIRYALLCHLCITIELQGKHCFYLPTMSAYLKYIVFVYWLQKSILSLVFIFYELQSLSCEIKISYYGKTKQSVRRNRIPGNTKSHWNAIKIAKDINVTDGTGMS